MMRDARHAAENTSYEGGDDDDEVSDHDHGDEGGDHDASVSTTSSNHGCEGFNDPSGSTPPCQLLDVEMLELENVPYVSPEIEK